MKAIKTPRGWQVEILVRVQGELVHRSVTKPSKTEALRQALNLTEALKAGQKGSLKFLKECLDRYKEKHPDSWDDYVYERLKSWTLNIPLSGVMDTMKEQLINFMDQDPKPSPSAYNKLVGLAKISVRWCYGEKLVAADYLGKLKKVPEPPRERYISQDEFLRIYNRLPEWAKPITQCAYRVGARAGELRKLLKQDVDLLNGKIFIRAENTKTKSERYVPVPKEMRAYFASQPGPWAFTCEGRQVLKDGLTHAFGKAVDGCGMSDTHFHDLRAACATNLDSQGVRRVVIKILLGHSVAGSREDRMFYVYNRLKDWGELEEAINGKNSLYTVLLPETQVKVA